MDRGTSGDAGGRHPGPARRWAQRIPRATLHIPRGVFTIVGKKKNPDGSSGPETNPRTDGGRE